MKKKQDPVVAETPVETPPHVDPEAAKHRPMLLLPPNLACLAKLTADDNKKWSLGGVQVVSTETGYRASATDGKYLGVVSGIMDDANEYPELPTLKSAPNTATDAIIPASTWAEAFKLPPKRAIKPVIKNLATVLGQNETTFGATDFEKTRTVATRNVEGRFPAIMDIINDPKRELQAKVRVNAKRLRELLAVAEQFCDEDDGNTGVTLELNGDKPVIVRSQSKTQKFFGLLMPLS